MCILKNPHNSDCNAMGVKRWNVLISFFDSLKNFYVQNINDLPIIQEVSSSLQLLKENKLLTYDGLKIGDLVAAKYENDGLWYRAKILSVDVNAIKVQFIDYGNSELSSKFKKLPEKLASSPAMAYHCILDNIDIEESILITNNEVYDIVFNFLMSIELVLTFLTIDNFRMVKMEWDKRNIKTIINNIISYGITPKTYETYKQFDQLGVKMPVTLTYISSINEFYVENQNSKEIQSKIEYELENRTDWLPVTEYKFGNMAIAKSTTDNRWYRVRILETLNTENLDCYLIDYGTRDKCTEFYEAVDYLESAPPVVKRCSLHLPEKLRSDNLIASLSKSFIDEIERCKDQKVIIYIIKAGEPSVVKLYVNDSNIVDIIKPISVKIFWVNSFNALTVQVNTPGRLYVNKKLQNIKTLCSAKKPVVGKIYGANVSDKWYRVKLLNMSTDVIEVIMVDMGCLIVFVKKLFILPAYLEKIQYFALQCSLNLNNLYFSSKKLRHIIDNGRTEFKMIVLQNNEVNGHHIQLFLNGRDVSEMIKKDKK